MARKKRSQKHNLSPDFRSDQREKLVRRYRKTILFNERERSLVDQYCKKFSVRNKSSFMRDIVISHILEQLDDNYPKLF
ncbi:MAG: hypothetical protein IKX34_07995 [Bacteroidales bacterium]|nr:hypothetical protein [Bacteroidales bacterium]